MANSFIGCSKEKRAIGRSVRIISFILMTACFVLQIVNFEHPFRDLMYLTIWGMYLTLFALLFGILTNDSSFVPEGKFKLKAWKFWTILYELAFISEIAITIYFWGFLFDECPN